MRSLVAGCLSLGVLVLCAYLNAGFPGETVQLHLRLRDADTGEELAGIVRFRPKIGGKPLVLTGLYDRLKGIQKTETVTGWYVVGRSGATLTLPRGVWISEALSGLETRLVRQELDLTNQSSSRITLNLPYLFRPEKQGLIAGNTHLHLRQLTKEDAEEYLKQIPAADGLKVLFISYLERFQDDATFITNRYPVGDLKEFDPTGVLIHNGEEYRHNFGAYGQGYGHVMLLNLQRFIKPASLGPGITGSGFDDDALLEGIAEARRQGGTIIWCHNTFGWEATVHALAGRLDALNVFDGGRTGKFEERYYLYLNVGLRLPLSTGTDWFMYDLARVYAQLREPVTAVRWLNAVKAGRCVVTNGPLLTLTVDGQPVGEVIHLDKPRSVKIEASGIGRHNFQQLQLIHNGRVIRTQAAEAIDGGFRAHLRQELRIDEPSWLAVRIETTTRNEFDQPLFAHTAPVYLDLAGHRVFQPEAAQTLLKHLGEAQAVIRAKGKFSSPQAAERVLALYEEASRQLRQRLREGGKP
ncbi:MAG: CehA/McbA family metallohydrolase [Gemmataceae bacterium]|nr:CehA/McbA family metallohydrolase [Gemmataceae bacterium]MDW8267369.1 CehA/McbA family metallohydrolase [Gemmataceae bacterium]